MHTLDSFHKLAAAVAPKLHISVNMKRITTATATVDMFEIKATGNGLPCDINVNGDTPASAVERLIKAVAQARRRHETERVLARLEGDWTEAERESMRNRLLNVYGREGFDACAANIRQLDAVRAKYQEAA